MKKESLILFPSQELIQEYGLTCIVFVVLGICLGVWLHQYVLCIVLPILFAAFVYYFEFRHMPLRTRVKLDSSGISILDRESVVFFLPKDQIASIEVAAPQLGSRLDYRKSVIVWAYNKNFNKQPTKENQIYLPLLPWNNMHEIAPEQGGWIFLGEYNINAAELLVSELQKIYGC